MPPAVEVQSLMHWTAREVPGYGRFDPETAWSSSPNPGLSVSLTAASTLVWWAPGLAGGGRGDTIKSAPTSASQKCMGVGCVAWLR